MKIGSGVTAKIFVAAFLAILCLPTVQQVLHPIAVEPVVESRQKVEMPAGNWIAGLWLAKGYFSDYERHFNDVFGFRDFFIRLRNQIQYSLFHDSDQVIVGRNGWLVDKDSVNIEEVTVDTLSDAQWDHLKSRLEKLNGILRQKGITFLVIPVPFKNTVYPEEFPASTARRPVPTGYERFRRLLGSSGVPFVDAYSILYRNRGAGVFYRTDIHWNYLGARLVAQAAVKKLASMTHARIAWRYPETVVTQPFAGGVEANLLAVFRPPQDIEPAAYQPGDECGPTMPATAVQPAHFINQCRGAKLPSMTMIGNSYMLQMADIGFQDHFSEVYRLYDIQQFSNLLHELKPGTKIVIWQNFELEIGYQMQSDVFWKDVDAYRGAAKK